MDDTGGIGMKGMYSACEMHMNIWGQMEDCGRLMVPQIGPCPNPCTSHDKRDFADTIKILRMGDYHG